MSEKNLYKYLKEGLEQSKFVLERIECISLQGVPDVCYFHPLMTGCGWIELKYMDTWPKQAVTIPEIRHFTNHQRLWIYQKGQMSKRVFLLLAVGNGPGQGKDYLLFDHLGVLAINKVIKQRLFGMAVKTWMDGIDFIRLASILIYSGIE